MRHRPKMRFVTGVEAVPTKKPSGMASLRMGDRDDFTPEQVAYGRAMLALRRRLGRNPTWSEVLEATKTFLDAWRLEASGDATDAA